MDKAARIKLFSSFFILVASFFIYHCLYEIPEEFFYEAKEWAEKYGYELESHKYISEDGFVTTIHRIPRGRNKDNKTKRTPVLLQGGIFCASDHFLYLGPEFDLPYILADNGFDVWINNIRGNHYSREHINGTLSTDQYFQYNSWHQISQYELPAAINYIINVTKQDTLDFIGFSMGNTIYMAMGAQELKHLEKINKTIFMAPVYLKKARGFYKIASSLQKLIDDLFLSQRSYLRTALISFLFKDFNLFLPCVMNVIDRIAGEEIQRNSTLFALVAAHHPSGPSAAQVEQYLDNFVSGQFRMKNYGPVENLKLYGQEDPPIYDLKAINKPIHIFYSESDPVAGYEQVMMISKTLPNVVSIIPVKSPFAHYNFLTHNSKPPLVYWEMLQILKN